MRDQLKKDKIKHSEEKSYDSRLNSTWKPIEESGLRSAVNNIVQEWT